MSAMASVAPVGAKTVQLGDMVSAQVIGHRPSAARMAMPPPAAPMTSAPMVVLINAETTVRPTAARAPTDRAPIAHAMTDHAAMTRAPRALAARAPVNASSVTIAPARTHREATTAAPLPITPAMRNVVALRTTSALPLVAPNRPSRVKTMAACACPSS